MKKDSVMESVPDSSGKSTSDRQSGKPLGRRAALARLGLGAAVVYAAPVILQIDRESQALAATPCDPGKGKGKGKGKTPSWCRRRSRR